MVNGTHTQRSRVLASVTAALCMAATLVTASWPASAATAVITTVAGGDGEGRATEVAQTPVALATAGPFLYVGDQAHNLVRVVDTRSGQERVMAGNGFFEWSGGPQPLGEAGDGGTATEALLSVSAAMGLAPDGAGNLYIADAASNRVRKVDTSGTITTAVGQSAGCCAGFGGDGGPATEAQLSYPMDVVVDGAGNLYVADFYNHRVRKVDPSGRITTAAGDGTDGPKTDGVPATASSLQLPRSLAVDSGGNLYVGAADFVRRISTTGVITTVAGSGQSGPAGDGGPATAAHIDVAGIGLDAAGNIFIADDHTRVRRVDAATGIIGTVAGRGSAGRGDGGPAVEAHIVRPSDVTVDAGGNLYIADSADRRVRRVDSSGIISTVAGNGESDFSGDGGPAVAAELDRPYGMAADASGNLYIADYENNRVRMVDPSGRITTLASIYQPRSLVVDPGGNLYVAGGDVVRRVDASGAVSIYAGYGLATGAEGDGRPATEADLGLSNNGYPSGLALDDAGNLYIADSENNSVRRVDPSGIITTVASGDSRRSCSLGDPPGPELFCPTALATDNAGNLYIAEPLANRVRKLDALGNLHAVPLSGVSPDVAGLAVDPAGNLFMSAPRASVVFKREPGGPVTRIAGTGVRGFVGDGGPGDQAKLAYPRGIALAGADLLVADTDNDRVRRLAGVGQGATTSTTRLKSWGWNGVGQGGTSSLVDSATPAQVAGLGPVSTVAAGYYHSLAMRNGEVWAWGWNHFGQLGTGDRIDRSTPVRVPGLTNVVSVAAGAYHSLAATKDGAVWAWGWNGFGQLGTVEGADSLTPVMSLVPLGGNQVAAGAVHSVARSLDGQAWSWGWNGLGQLGDGTTTDRRLPVRALGLGGVASVTAGGYHTLGRQANGTLWAWGWNALGQLGDGTTVDRRWPVRVAAGPVDSVAAGIFHSVATAGGLAWAWGWNGFGQLGDGTTAERHSPVAVARLDGVSDIGAGAYHSLAVRVDGTLRAWGWNGLGQLGDGTTNDHHLPVSVTGVQDASGATGGAVHTLAR